MKNIQKPLITNQKKQQETQVPDSGRSMVEMLGTLAVIGVLSITGVMGYKYAMNKYQVNKIANELNVLSQQIFLTMSMPHNGEYELSLGEVYDEGSITTASYAFDFGCGNDITVETPCTEDEPHYFISLEAVPAEIRLPLAQLMEQLPNVTIVTNNEELLAFVYTRDDITEDGNSVVSTSNDVAVTTMTESITTKETTFATSTSPSTLETLSSTTIQTITEIVTSSPIFTTTDSVPMGECSTNEDCVKTHGVGYYCWTYATCSAGNENIEEGKCLKVEIDRSATSVIDGAKIIISQKSMNWWSAERFCKAAKAANEVEQGVLIDMNEYNCIDFDNTIWHADCIDKNTGGNPLMDTLDIAFAWSRTKHATDECCMYIAHYDHQYGASYMSDDSYPKAVCK